MTEQEKLAYLTRAFERATENAVLSAGKARLRVQVEASKEGSLETSRMARTVAVEYVRELSEAADRAARLAFEATGSTSDAVCEVVRKGLFKLRDALSDDLVAFFRARPAPAAGLGHMVSNWFLQDADKRILSVVDDLRHGIVGGQRLGKDPVISVISTVTNSPGAVLQSGIGNV
jgi:hypothetical protein